MPSHTIYLPRDLVVQLGGSYLNQKDTLSASARSMLAHPYHWDEQALSALLAMSQTDMKLSLKPLNMVGENGHTFHRPGWYEITQQ